MSIRFKLELLGKLGRSPHRGFVLPAAIMLGLVVLIAGATILIRAQGDQTNAISQKAKAASMAAAETGLARVQNIFAQAKFVSLYNDSDWATVVNNNGVPVNGTNAATGTGNTTADQWSKYITNLASNGNSACSTATPSSSATAALQAQLANLKTMAGGTSQAIDGKNSFRLVKYQYAGTAGQLPNGQAIGRLTIEGKSMEGGGEAVSRLMVDLPISGAVTNQVPLTDTVPGLWVKEGGIDKNWESSTQTAVASNSDNYTFQADIRFSDCGSNKLTSNYVSDVQNQITTTGRTADKTVWTMPSIPAIPTGITPASLASSSLGNNKNNVTNFTATAFPAPTDADGYAYYRVSGDLGGYMSVPAGRKVKIYVDGDINVSLQHDSTPTNVQIFGKKPSGGTICMNGNDAANINAFILAPTYDAGKTGNGQLRGSLFVKSWGKSSCMSSNPTVAMVQTQTWGDIPPELRPQSMPMPTIANFSGWKELAADADPPAPN